jgi:hypothetical protein
MLADEKVLEERSISYVHVDVARLGKSLARNRHDN